jgi:hypothetical protein
MFSRIVIVILFICCAHNAIGGDSLKAKKIILSIDAQILVHFSKPWKIKSLRSWEGSDGYYKENFSIVNKTALLPGVLIKIAPENKKKIKYELSLGYTFFSLHTVAKGNSENYWYYQGYTYFNGTVERRTNFHLLSIGNGILFSWRKMNLTNVFFASMVMQYSDRQSWHNELDNTTHETIKKVRFLHNTVPVRDVFFISQHKFSYELPKKKLIPFIGGNIYYFPSDPLELTGFSIISGLTLKF